MIFDFTVVGGGIVGLATAAALKRREPDASVLLLEKEQDLALHQTGRNSGVIHSGIYYKPGSLKARLARDGSASMAAFCEENDLPFEICGKIIVATDETERPRLEQLYLRGRENGLAVERLTPGRVAEIEPHVRCIAAVQVPSTGIADYRQVACKLAQTILALGGTVQTGARVRHTVERYNIQVLETTLGVFQSRFVINCAGLFSDRLAQASGAQVDARIVPFRGEYYELIPGKRSLVRNLVYPVPDPSFPFLGVHFTRMIDGSVHAGPNAVLAFKREGYRRLDVAIPDVLDTLTYPGFWKLARRHFREGLREIGRSLNKAAFVRSLQRLIPAVQAADLVPSPAGVRAQALSRSGALVDDFLIVRGRNAVHVCNAPSPAATASLEIAKLIACDIPLSQTKTVVAV